jgi:Secretion system C-terminal sorting domain
MKIKFLFLFFLFFVACVYVNAQKNNPCDPGEEKPPCPQMGCHQPNCDCKQQGDSSKLPVIGAIDPNEIIGPAGYDSVMKWISVHATLPYRVLFENDPDSATSAAQKVIIYVPIHPNINPASLRLSDFGFGPFVFTVPDNSTIYTNRLDVRDSLGVYVDITAGLDISNRRAFWIFESIDPVTGLASTLAPGAGFLPINDTARGNGEGFVSFTLQPIPTVLTRDTIAEKASIIFDDNEAIETNVEKNTIDAVAPQSLLTMASVVGDTIHLFWNGQDDPPGCGVKDYDLYVSINNGPFILYKKNIAALHEIFLATPGNNYCFFTRARDNTGNLEPLKDSCELRVGGGTIPITWLYFNGRKDNEIVNLNWATGNEQNTDRFWVERSINGTNYTDIGSRKAAGNSSSTRTYQYPDVDGPKLPAPILYYRIRQVDLDGKFTYSNVVAIQNTKAANGPLVQVYPNPFTQQLNVKVHSAAAPATEDRLELYDNAGILVYNRSLANRPANGVVNINNLPFLTQGVYYLRVYVGGEKEVVKIVKQ